MKIEIAGNKGKDNYIIDIDSLRDFFSIGTFDSSSIMFGSEAVVSYDMNLHGSGFAIETYLSTGHVVHKDRVRYGMEKDKAIVYMFKDARKRGIDIDQVADALNLMATSNSNKPVRTIPA